MTIPLGIIGLVVVGAVSFLGYSLATTTSAMYIDGVDMLAGPASRNEAETVVYTSLRPANWDVYLFEDLNSAPRRLTLHPNLDYNAVLSPGGRWVVFVSERRGNADLFALDLSTADGEPVPLTNSLAMDDAPAFSPDGSRLAFVSSRSGNPDVFVMPFDPENAGAESEARNISNSPYGDFNPAFSPDGSRIAFSSNRAVFRRWNPIRLAEFAPALTDIYVADADGSNLQRVIRGVAMSGSPAWTEAGDGLLYYQTSDPTRGSVYRTTLENGETVRLSPESLMALTPTPGPDGSVIFAGMDPGETPESEPAPARHGGRLYTVDEEGGNLTTLDDDDNGYLSPHYDAASGMLVAHGDGPLDTEVEMYNGSPFTWAGAVNTVGLPGRDLRLHAMRGYFPSLASGSDRVVAVRTVDRDYEIRFGPPDIVSAELDGTDQVSIVPPPADSLVWTPVISDDGEWIFYASGSSFAAVDVDVDIWKVRPDGSGAVNLTADSDWNDGFPDVSRDGTRIVFRSGRNAAPGSGREGNKEIYVMDQDGGSLRRVTHDDGNDTMPAISPDGRWVVYSTDRAGNGMKLWIQSLEDSGDEGRLLEPDRAHLRGLDMHPRFSPDGTWVVFTSDRGGLMDEFVLSGLFPQPYGELFAVPIDGSTPAVRLTHDKWEDSLAFWSEVIPAGNVQSVGAND